MKKAYWIILTIVILMSPALSYAKDSYSEEENQIRNKSKEYKAVVYYKDGEKVKTEYIQGKGHSVTYSPSKILNEAKELEADKVVFIHNHPSGTTKTSDADIKSKERVEAKFDNTNIETEHVVVTKHSERRY